MSTCLEPRSKFKSQIEFQTDKQFWGGIKDVTFELILTCKVSLCLHTLSISETWYLLSWHLLEQTQR